MTHRFAFLFLALLIVVASAIRLKDPGVGPPSKIEAGDQEESQADDQLLKTESVDQPAPVDDRLAEPDFSDQPTSVEEQQVKSDSAEQPSVDQQAEIVSVDQAAAQDPAVPAASSIPPPDLPQSAEAPTLTAVASQQSPPSDGPSSIIPSSFEVPPKGLDLAAAAKSSLGPEEGRTEESTSFALRAASPVRSVSSVFKPEISKEFVPHLFNFTQPTMPYKSCWDVANELDENEATRRAHMQLIVILNTLHPTSHDEPGETIINDKTCMNSLNILNSLMVARDGYLDDSGAGDLVNYMEDIIQCKVEMDTGRGILQKILEYGMEKSLKTPFVFTLLKGAANYDPSFILDNNGNNLMHLAVMSNAYNMVAALQDLEIRINAGDRTRRMNGLYWMMSALIHRNHDGKRPLEMCASDATRQELKRLFRAAVMYLRCQNKRSYADFDKVNEILKTSAGMSATDFKTGPHIQSKL